MARRFKGFKKLPHDCSHPDGFQHDNRTPYRMRILDGHKIETWRECCPNCGSWVEIERIDGEVQ